MLRMPVNVVCRKYREKECISGGPYLDLGKNVVKSY